MHSYISNSEEIQDNEENFAFSRSQAPKARTMKHLILLILFFISPFSGACPESALCEGDRIIDRNGDVGKIVKIFEDVVEVRLDRHKFPHPPPRSPTIYQAGAISKAVGCIGKICVGDSIIDTNDHTGKVAEVFSDGRTYIYFDRFRYPAAPPPYEPAYYIRHVDQLKRRCESNLKGTVARSARSTF